jgi:pyruvate dehydrogenase E1 component alpha subunit
MSCWKLDAEPQFVQVPVGAGLALAHKMKGEKNCAFALYGDGAANQGQIAEAMNTSALWNVPVIFVCENNHYGMGTSDLRGSKSSSFYKRGDYIPGIRVDGMDVLAVKQVTIWAKQFVLEHGPICLEADTYRRAPHACVCAWTGVARAVPERCRASGAVP